MGTSLTGTKIRDTYDALIKVSDNGALDGTLQVLTDGLGNNSALSLSTAGASVGGTLAVSGNLTVDTNTLFVDASSDSVSINDNVTANVPLTVTTNSGYEDVLYLKSSGTNIDSRISMFPTGTGNAVINAATNSLEFQIGGSEKVRVDSSGDISFRDSSANEAFYWDASAGRLGIGTNNPYGRIHSWQGSSGQASANSVANGLVIEDNQGQGISILTPSANEGNIFFGDEADNFIGGIRYFHTNDSLSFYVNNAERMLINSSGNVGINNTSPNISGFSKAITLGGSDSGYEIANSGVITAILSGNSQGAGVTGVGSSGIRFFTSASGATTERMRITSGGNVLINKQSPRGSEYLGIESSGAEFCNFQNTSGARAFRVNNVNSEGFNASATAIFVGADGTTSRSINAGGTINAIGTDYAEYMTKAVQDNIEKGDIVGVDINGQLTNVFADAISFVVKSTNPSYVGGDTWGIDLEGDDLEQARIKVDRIAFAGQIPCNVLNSNVGDYIVPIELEDGKISGQSISNPTLEQYMISVGKVWKIMDDGRAWISVKIG